MTRSPRAASASCSAVVVALLIAVAAPSGEAVGADRKTGRASPSSSTERSKSEAERRKAALQKRLKALHDELDRSEATRAEVRDALRESENAISVSTRELRRLAGDQDAARARLAATLSERDRTRAEIVADQASIDVLVRAQYFASRQNPWHALWAGENPNDIGRATARLSYVARALEAGISRLTDAEMRLAQLADDERARSEQLQTLGERREAERRALEARKREHAEVLRNVSEDIRARRREVGVLERDARRLDGLIDRLAKTLAEAAERQRRLASEPERRQRAARNDRRAREAAPPHPVDRPAQSGETELSASDAFQPGIPFVSLRGRLPLPVRGQVAARFGQSRRDGPAWKGWFVRAPTGTDVRAVADGRVVFSDWLRGFGNLLILDHGGEFLTVYGSNEALLKRGGDTVRAGEPIATVGATGGSETPGLYFEVRHKGAPQDPAHWVR